MASVLLLNADAQPLSLLPLSIISWQNAIKAYYQEKVDIIKNYDDKVINSPSVSMPMPSVVMLRRYHRRPHNAKFSRRNMYVRDDYTCQYCNQQFDSAYLTIDHVIPKCRGGDTSWDNCTTACKPCNSNKSDKLIRPIIQPYNPSWYQINNGKKRIKLIIPDEGWREFIDWPQDLVQYKRDFEYNH